MGDRLRWSARTKFETRLDEDKQVGLIVGYAAVINQPTELWPGFVEEIAPGAFVDTIRDDDIRALFNHSEMVVLGRNTAGTLRLAEDSIGLHYEIDADLQIVAVGDVYRMIVRRDVTQSSFGFEILAEEWVYPETGDDPIRCTIKKVRLWDVAPVTFAAYPQTEVEARQDRFLHVIADQAHRDLADVRRMEPTQLRSLFAATPPSKLVVPPRTPLLTAAYAELRKRQYG